MKSISIFFLLTTLTRPVLAVTITSVSPAYTDGVTFSVNSVAAGSNVEVITRTFSMGLADGNGGIHKTADECISISSGALYTATKDFTTSPITTSLAGRELPVIITRQAYDHVTFGGRTSTAIVFKNSCDYSRTNTFTVGVTSRGNDDTWNAVNRQIVTFPAGSSCSLDINTSPVIPTITTRQEIDEVVFTSDMAGTGTLTFKPDENVGTKGKMSNGDDYLTYSVPNATWDATNKQWTGDLSGQYSIKIDTPASSVSAGEYTGTMQATISCQ